MSAPLTADQLGRGIERISRSDNSWCALVETRESPDTQPVIPTASSTRVTASSIRLADCHTLKAKYRAGHASRYPPPEPAGRDSPHMTSSPVPELNCRNHIAAPDYFTGLRPLGRALATSTKT